MKRQGSFSWIVAVASAVAGTLISCQATQADIFTISGAITANQDAAADPGGTDFNNPVGSTAGKGLPTAAGNWPASARFAPDPSFGNALGISGYSGTNVFLAAGGTGVENITFTYYGSGDATLENVFLVDQGGGTFTKIFDTLTSKQGDSVTIPVALNADGTLRFEFVTGAGVTLLNGTNNGTHAQGPGYFLGIDPYGAGLNAPYQTSGFIAYAGLADRSTTATDHDYQDMVIQISVPEPASFVLMGLGASVIGLAARRRIRSAR